MNPREPYLTAREMREYLRLGSDSALYRLIREHEMPHGRIGRLYRFDRREVDAWIRQFSSSIEWERAKRKAS